MLPMVQSYKRGCFLWHFLTIPSASFPVILPSSWMATVDGQKNGACPGLPDIKPVAKPSVILQIIAAASVSGTLQYMPFPQRIGNVPKRRSVR